MRRPSSSPRSRPCSPRSPRRSHPPRRPPSAGAPVFPRRTPGTATSPGRRWTRAAGATSRPSARAEAASGLRRRRRLRDPADGRRAVAAARADHLHGVARRVRSRPVPGAARRARGGRVGPPCARRAAGDLQALRAVRRPSAPATAGRPARARRSTCAPARCGPRGWTSSRRLPGCPIARGPSPRPDEASSGAIEHALQKGSPVPRSSR